MRDLATDILREKAAVLGRIATLLQVHMDALARCGERLQTLEGEPLAAAREEWIQLRADAERWRWYLIVQRESLGLHDPRPVLEAYPIPARPPQR